MVEHCDIAIIGGGPVGAALSLALRDSGLQITLLEARKATEANPDPRALALSYGSRLLLAQLGVWQNLTQISAIKTIHISQKNSFGRTRLNADEIKVPDLGYVLPYATLQATLQYAIQQERINFKSEASVDQLQPDAEGGASITYHQDGTERQLHARLVVVADGGKLLATTHPAEVHDYGQNAIIAHVTCTQPKPDTAYERFTPQGPIALLPYRDGYELVWTVPQEAVNDMLQWDNATLLTQLHQHFGDRVGTFLSAGTRNTYALSLRQAPDITLPHTVLIGNAAQTLHPVAGQGFNLGLRDACELARLIHSSAPDTLGSASMLSSYKQSRNWDRSTGIRFTDSLVRLFSNDWPLLGASRAASLSLLDCLPGVKKFVAKRMMFGVNG